MGATELLLSSQFFGFSIWRLTGFQRDVPDATSLDFLFACMCVCYFPTLSRFSHLKCVSVRIARGLVFLVFLKGVGAVFDPTITGGAQFCHTASDPWELRLLIGYSGCSC